MKWPTLKDRLKNALKDEKTALEQLKSMIPLSDWAEKRLEKLKKKINNDIKTI